VHFNNAGAALQPEPVFHAVTAHLELEYAIGGYEAKVQSQASSIIPTPPSQHF
jgi:hypothetical protein